MGLRISGWVRIALLVLSSLGGAVSVLGCAQKVIADPRATAQAYAQAIQAGDAETLYALLNAEGRSALSPGEVQALLRASKPELLARAHQFAAAESEIRAEGTVRFHDGEQAVLSLEDGAFRVRAAGVLPGGANTPEQVMLELRSALSRRSYSALSRVLTKQSRDELEDMLRSLSDGLKEPTALPLQTNADQVVVTVPGGHRVELRREDGQWKVQDFE
ncbi:MAG: hypothetical protein RJA70_826 [Pseudomonadota bacterium]|jgi:hypothetical protein